VNTSTKADIPIPGVTAALATMYSSDLSVDYEATAGHAQFLVQEGIGSVLVAGTSGEGRWLSSNERAKLIAAVRRALPDTVPVVAGITCEAGETAGLDGRDAVHAGAAGVVCLSSGSEDPSSFYMRVTQLCPAEFLLAYHQPTETSPGLRVDQIAHLPVDGVKDASGDANRMATLLASDAKPLYVGAGLLGLAKAAGCAGAILAIANVDPRLCLRIWEGDLTLMPELIRLQASASTDFPLGLKTLMTARFGTSGMSRRPIASAGIGFGSPTGLRQS
jgi:4-hydroxy-tetrahydrodipicolinate synthase